MIWLAFILSYLLGSIPFALIVGRIFFKADIRKHGSGNLGATNSVRVLGFKAGLIVALGDVVKGVAAASLPFILNVDIDPFTLGLAAIVGHCFPVFAGFRGGKAIATTAGVLIVSYPYLLIFAYALFFAVIFVTKYVVYGSLSVGAAIIIYSLMFDNTIDITVALLFFVFLLFLHRSNIKNLLAGMEPKVNDKSIKDDRIKK